ncbi:hypothetical protein [Aliiruegeria haliotis]|nr:hypothetical protein [Aliiruegeria haliotis]
MKMEYRHRNPKDAPHGNDVFGEIMIRKVIDWCNALPPDADAPAPEGGAIAHCVIVMLRYN